MVYIHSKIDLGQLTPVLTLGIVYNLVHTTNNAAATTNTASIMHSIYVPHSLSLGGLISLYIPSPLYRQEIKQRVARLLVVYIHSKIDLGQLTPVLTLGIVYNLILEVHTTNNAATTNTCQYYAQHLCSLV